MFLHIDFEISNTEYQDKLKNMQGAKNAAIGGIGFYEVEIVPMNLLSHFKYLI